MQDSVQQGARLPVSKFLVAGITLLLLSKIFLATVLDLYSDEAFYWQASENPAIAYSDLPFMTALLIGLGSALDSYNTLAARSLRSGARGARPQRAAPKVSSTVLNIISMR